MKFLSQTVHIKSTFSLSLSGCRLQVLGMMENPTSIMMMRVWSQTAWRESWSRRVEFSGRVLRINEGGLCNSGSFWSLCWMTHPTATSLLGLAVGSSLNSLNQRRSVCYESKWLYRPLFYFSQLAELTPTFSIGCSPLGYPEEQACDELWQAEPLPALLLWEGHHAEGKGTFTFQCHFSSFNPLIIRL